MSVFSCEWTHYRLLLILKYYHWTRNGCDFMFPPSLFYKASIIYFIWKKALIHNNKPFLGILLQISFDTLNDPGIAKGKRVFLSCIKILLWKLFLNPYAIMCISKN